MIFWFKEIKKHNVPILISLLIGIIFLLSQVLPMFAIGDSFDGVQFLYQDDDYLYLAHIKDIVDGHFKSSSPVFFEYKDAVPVMFPFVYYFYALPTLLLGIPLLVTILLSKAFLPAVAFFLAYYLSLKMMSGVDIFYKKISAVATGLLVVFAYDIVNPINLISIFSSFGENFYQSPLLRLVNPVSGLVLLLTSFILLWHFHKKDYKKNYKKIIATASLFFVMSGYIFSYAISLTALVLLILLSVYKKHFTKVRGLIFIFIVAILPFLYQFMISLNSEDGNSSALKMGLFYTHEILFNTFLIVFVILFITSSSYLAISRKYKNLYKDKSWQFLAIIFLSLIIVYSQQLITGMTVWPFHFVQYSVPLIYIAFVVFLHNFVLPCSKKIWQVVIIGIFFITCTLAGSYLFNFNVVLKDFLSQQEYGNFFEWVEKNANSECVFLVVENERKNLDEKIPAYTKCNVYYSEYVFFGVPDERIEYNYFSHLKIKGVNIQNFDEYVSKNETQFRNVFFEEWTQKFSDKNDSWLVKIRNDEEIQKWKRNKISYLKSEYSKFYLEEDFKVQLSEYKLDYVVWNKENFPKWQYENFSFLEKKYEDETVVIFSL